MKEWAWGWVKEWGWGWVNEWAGHCSAGSPQRSDESDGQTGSRVTLGEEPNQQVTADVATAVQCDPGWAYSQMWEKRFSKEYTLRPIFLEMALQLLPWRLCNLIRECSSFSENLPKNMLP